MNEVNDNFKGLKEDERFVFTNILNDPYLSNILNNG